MLLKEDTLEHAQSKYFDIYRRKCCNCFSLGWNGVCNEASGCKELKDEEGQSQMQPKLADMNQGSCSLKGGA